MNKLTNEYLEACAVDDTPAFDSLEIQEILINQKLRELLENEITCLSDYGAMELMQYQTDVEHAKSVNKIPVDAHKINADDADRKLTLLKKLLEDSKK